jgi:exopolysaccharide production protein ExoQ
MRCTLRCFCEETYGVEDPCGYKRVRQIATLVYAVGILGLFLLNLDRKGKTSWALFLPCFWLLLAGSRNIGDWLQMGAPTDSGDAYLEGNPLDRNVLAALVAFGVGILFVRRRRVWNMLKSNVPILLFFLYCGLSILWSDYPYVGFKRWIRASGDLVMVLVILSDCDWVGARKKVLAWVSFFLLPLSVLFIRYYPELGRAYGQYDYTVSWTGVTTTKNGLGMISMIFGLASASRLIDAYRTWKRAGSRRLMIAHGIIFVIAVYLIHVAHSATSLACFVLGCGMLFVTSRRLAVQRPILVHIVVAAILLFTFSTLFLNVDLGVIEGLGRNATLTGRTDVWERALKLVKNPMLGAGFESFWIGPRLAKMRSLDPGLNQAHNGYLEIYLNLGWVGAILLAIVVVMGYRSIIASFRRDPGPARLSLVFFVVTLSYNFTEGAFKMMMPIWIMFLMAIVSIPVAVPEMLSSVKRTRRGLRNGAKGSSQIQIEDPLGVELRQRTV